MIHVRCFVILNILIPRRAGPSRPGSHAAVLVMLTLEALHFIILGHLTDMMDTSTIDMMSTFCFSIPSHSNFLRTSLGPPAISAATVSGVLPGCCMASLMTRKRWASPVTSLRGSKHPPKVGICPRAMPINIKYYNIL